MSREVIHVPLYLSQLRLVEVTGIKRAAVEKWKNYQSELALAASYLKYNKEFGNPGKFNPVCRSINYFLSSCMSWLSD